jgi:hypothetical protein
MIREGSCVIERGEYKVRVKVIMEWNEKKERVK